MPRSDGRTKLTVLSAWCCGLGTFRWKGNEEGWTCVKCGKPLVFVHRPKARRPGRRVVVLREAKVELLPEREAAWRRFKAEFLGGEKEGLGAA